MAREPLAHGRMLVGGLVVEDRVDGLAGGNGALDKHGFDGRQMNASDGDERKAANAASRSMARSSENGACARSSIISAPDARAACAYSPNAGSKTSTRCPGPANARTIAQISSTDPAPATTCSSDESPSRAAMRAVSGAAVGCPQ